VGHPKGGRRCVKHLERREAVSSAVGLSKHAEQSGVAELLEILMACPNYLPT
jgi:hypothetical protein